LGDIKYTLKAPSPTKKDLLHTQKSFDILHRNIYACWRALEFWESFDFSINP
jgi:hypothetical protein